MHGIVLWILKREHNEIDFKKKKNKVNNKRAAGIIWMKKSVIFLKKIESKYLKDKKYCKVTDHCCYAGEYRGAANSICNFKYSVPKKFL